MKSRRTGRTAPSYFCFFLCGLFAAAVNAGAATLEELAGQPELWPAEVVVKAATKAVVLKDGKPAGMMLLGAGMTIRVSDVSAAGVTGHTANVIVLVPAEKTDLLTRARTAAGVPAPAGASEPAKPAMTADARPAAPARPPETQAPAGPVSTVQRQLLGRLVQLRDGALKPYDLRRVSGVKYYGIMFSAGWCGPCRAFAPRLLEAYRKIKEVYPEFELVLVSWDRSPDDMLAYMRDENMPWPALKFSALQDTPEITRLAGPGIPCLVLIDAEGTVLAHSFKGDDYLGPDSVLDATWRTLQQNRRTASR